MCVCVSFPGALYLEEGDFTCDGAVQFLHNSAGIGGGALAGSSQSILHITGNSTLFLGNTAEKVSSTSWL
jgi:predicted outer membrane repeat protein